MSADPFRRPGGTRSIASPFPALKRRAIFSQSLRDSILQPTNQKIDRFTFFTPALYATVVNLRLRIRVRLQAHRNGRP